MRLWRFVWEMVKLSISDARKKHRTNFERNMTYEAYRPNVLGKKLRSE